MKRQSSRDTGIAAVQAEIGSAEGRRALTAEFLGTLLFVVFSAGTAAVTAGLLAERMTSARLLVMALAHGVAYAILVAATLPISGGHLNPAVTAAALMSKQIGLAKAGLYVIAQCAGAVAGALMLMIMIPPSLHGTLGAETLAARVTIAGGLLAEIILTAVLVAAALAAARGVSPVRLGVVGLVVVLGQLLGGPLTGGAMNPARVFGPALVTGAWANHWVYWFGPLVGASVGVVLHDFCFGVTSKGTTRSVSDLHHRPSPARSV